MKTKSEIILYLWISLLGLALGSAITLISLHYLGYNFENTTFICLFSICIVSITIFLIILVWALTIKPTNELEEEPFSNEEDNTQDFPKLKYTMDNLKNLNNIYLRLKAVPQQKLAKIFNCKPEKLEEEIKNLYHIIDCIHKTVNQAPSKEWLIQEEQKKEEL